jgi:hypothetical protein
MRKASLWVGLAIMVFGLLGMGLRVNLPLFLWSF